MSHAHKHLKRRNSKMASSTSKFGSSSMIKNKGDITGMHGAASVPEFDYDSSIFDDANNAPEEHNDKWNYALLIVLYTLQGIPMGLSASIPFLIQQKIKELSSVAAAGATGAATAAGAAAMQASSTANAAAAAKMSYNANAIFALCSWPFSLKLLWAPIVDALFLRRFGRRKTWLVPAQALAGILMVLGANFVQRQLGLGDVLTAVGAGQIDRELNGISGESKTLISQPSMNVRGVTVFFFVLYFLMATQDIAVDGWALTMLSKKNRGRGPVCNSIGQNIGYFISFVGFLALNDAEASENIWRPLLGLKSKAGVGLVSLGGFVRFMGYFMLATTTVVAIAKRETPLTPLISVPKSESSSAVVMGSSDGILINAKGGSPKKELPVDEDHELDASEIGLKETYHRLYAVCQLPSVQWLFLVLLTYRFPTALGDNVKFLKAVEQGLSKSTTALLSPTLILPLGILVPIFATKIWHGHPLRQFMTAYKIRVTLVPLLDLLMLHFLRERQASGRDHFSLLFWSTVVASTAMQAIVSSLQFNAQMTFFASRVDPAIGGSYMTLLNTAANLGGTWPSSTIMWVLGWFTSDSQCKPGKDGVGEICPEKNDPYLLLQVILSVLGCIWIGFFSPQVSRLAQLPDDAWRTHLLDDEINRPFDIESPSLVRNITKDEKHE